MLMYRNDLCGIAHIAIGQLRNMYQSVLFDAHIYKAAEVGDVGYDAGQNLSLFQIGNAFHRRIESDYLDMLAPVATGFI